MKERELKSEQLSCGATEDKNTNKKRFQTLTYSWGAVYCRIGGEPATGLRFGLAEDEDWQQVSLEFF